jgi:nucleoside-diphosphate-sugar epimerase
MDLLHAEDAARANVMALLESEVQDEIFNVGTGVETSVN